VDARHGSPTTIVVVSRCEGDAMSSTSAGEKQSRDDVSDESSKSSYAECQQLMSMPRPRHRSASPRDGMHDAGGPGCPVRGRRLTPSEMQSAEGVRRRYNSMSASTMARPTIAMRTAGVDTPRRLRVSRDATQPATGSMRSLRSSSQDSEEADEFPDRSFPGGISGLPVCGHLSRVEGVPTACSRAVVQPAADADTDAVGNRQRLAGNERRRGRRVCAAPGRHPPEHRLRQRTSQRPSDQVAESWELRRRPAGDQRVAVMSCRQRCHRPRSPSHTSSQYLFHPCPVFLSSSAH